MRFGSGKVRGGSSTVWEQGVKRAEPQRERDGGDSFLATTCLLYTSDAADE